MATAERLKNEDLFDALERLEPLIREHESEAEDAKRLSTPVIDALRDAGFYRMFRPTARGGLGLDIVTALEVGEALAKIDSAAAWNVQVCNASELYGGWFGEEASKAIFGSPHSIVAGAFNPHRRAQSVEGGYRISGRTPFNSNCHGATWVIGLADVFDGDVMRVDDTGLPEVLLAAIPADECRIVENWNTLGMCGTGSHDVEVDDVFVPGERAVPFGPLDRPSPGYDTPLANLVVWATVGAHAAVALGIAQAAIDDLRELGTKVPAYTQNALRNRSRVQLRLAQAEGKLAGARAFFHLAHREAWTIASDRGPLEMSEKARCQLASAMAAQTAAQVVDLVHSCVGTSGIREELPFQRHFRDVHVITQHAFLAEARLEDVGQIMFGLEPDWGFFAF